MQKFSCTINQLCDYTFYIIIKTHVVMMLWRKTCDKVTETPKYDMDEI